MLKILLPIFIFCLIFLGFVYVNRDNLAVANDEKILYVETSPENLLQFVNNYRTQADLQPLVHDENLCALAERRLSEIKSNWSHYRFKSAVSDFSKEKESSSYSLLAENLVKETASDKSAFDSWISSDGHRRTIIGDYDSTCIATDTGYAVQIFAKY